MRSSRTFLRDRLGVVLCICGVVALVAMGAFLFWQGYPSVYLLAVAVGIAGCLAYLLLLRMQPQEHQENRRAGIYDWVFWGLVIACVLVYVFRDDQYVRPLGYFILLALAVGVLSAKCLTIPEGGRVWPSLIQIVTIGFMTTLSVSLLFPTVVGLDPWWTQGKTILMVEQGDFQYRPLVVTHWITAGTMMVTGWSYRVATMASILPIQVVGDTILVYYIGQMVWSRRTGLLAALAVAFVGWHVFFVFWTIPMGLATTVVLGVLALMVAWHRGKVRWRVVIPSLLALTIVVISTHPIATMWAVFVVGTFWLVSGGWKIIVGKVRQALPMTAILAVMVLFVFALWQWMGYVGAFQKLLSQEFSPDKLVFTQPLGMPNNEEEELLPMVVDVVEVEEPREVQATDEVTIEAEETADVQDAGEVEELDEVIKPVDVQNDTEVEAIEPADALDIDEVPMVAEPATETIASASLGEWAVNSMGMFLFFGVAFVGVFRSMHRDSNGRAVALALLGVGFIVIGFIPALMGLSVLEHRWWMIAEIVMAIPLAIGLVMVARRMPRGWGVAVVGVFMAALAFLNIIGLPANIDNRTLSPNHIARYGFTQGELDAMRDVSAEFSGTIGVDGYYMLPRHLGILSGSQDRLRTISSFFIAGNPQDAGCDIVLVRDEIVEGVIAIGSGTIHRLNYNPCETLLRAGYSLVYENEDVKAFARGLDKD